MNKCPTVLFLHADLKNVAHARQRLVMADDLLGGNPRGNIRGVAVTPGGRLLVAVSVSSVSPGSHQAAFGYRQYLVSVCNSTELAS